MVLSSIERDLGSTRPRSARARIGPRSGDRSDLRPGTYSIVSSGRRPRSRRAAASPRPRPPRSRTRRRGRPRAVRRPRARPSPAPPPPRPARRAAAPAPLPSTSAVRTPESSAWCTQPPRAVGVAHPAPLAVLGGDLERQAAAHELPVDPLVEARAAPGVGALGPHRDEARQRQVGDRPARLRRPPPPRRRQRAPPARRRAPHTPRAARESCGRHGRSCSRALCAGKCLDFSGPPVQLCLRA